MWINKYKTEASPAMTFEVWLGLIVIAFLLGVQYVRTAPPSDNAATTVTHRYSTPLESQSDGVTATITSTGAGKLCQLRWKLPTDSVVHMNDWKERRLVMEEVQNLPANASKDIECK